MWHRIRSLNWLVLVAFAVLLLCPETAGAQTGKSLKFGYILSPNSQLGAGATVFADEINKRTNGRYKIEQYPNSSLGGTEKWKCSRASSSAP